MFTISVGVKASFVVGVVGYTIFCVTVPQVSLYPSYLHIVALLNQALELEIPTLPSSSPIFSSAAK
jgi:hypothetical protein